MKSLFFSEGEFQSDGEPTNAADEVADNIADHSG